MFNVGGGELLVILFVALVVLGPDKLPDAARKIGNIMGEVRRMSAGFQEEVRAAMDTPAKAVESVKDAVTHRGTTTETASETDAATGPTESPARPTPLPSPTEDDDIRPIDPTGDGGAAARTDDPAA